MEEVENVQNEELEVQTTFNNDGLDVLVEDGTIENENLEEPEGIGAVGDFAMRTNKPGASNKFYIRKSSGGYSSCIKGNPTDSNCDVLANCVGYACGRFNEIIGTMKYPNLNCNAENFIERAKNTYGLEISSVPTLGGIMVWQKGDTLSGGDGAGHVAIVEKIIDSNTIYTSESGYGSSAFWNSTRKNTNGRWGLGAGYKFRGCIVNPGVKKEIIPVSNDPYPNVSDEELAKRVWKGEFGNGDERKQKLGSRYSSVQALVNKGIGKPNTSTPIENKKYHIVQKGDTLWAIAKKYYGNGNQYPRIAQANNIKNPDIIYPGQKLLIP